MYLCSHFIHLHFINNKNDKAELLYFIKLKILFISHTTNEVKYISN